MTCDGTFDRIPHTGYAHVQLQFWTKVSSSFEHDLLAASPGQEEGILECRDGLHLDLHTILRSFGKCP